MSDALTPVEVEAKLRGLVNEVLLKLCAQTERVGDCLIWTGPKNQGGYGRIARSSGSSYVHRAAWIALRGPIPAGLHLDHLCRQRACWNPDHLEPVTPRENVLRGEGLPAVNVTKTHCPQGHPYDEQNTGRTPKGGRRCRACERAAYHRRRAAS